jgi:leader peptidase (prepilin peptidase)/N-methyltransferase
MNLIIGLFVFITGLIFGSFFNVCIFRIQKGESISYPPSHCTNCNNRLNWYDLVPALSYVFLKGQCRYCGEKISLRYPAIELITGILFYLVYFKYGITILTIKFIVFISILIIIGMIDFDTTDVYFSTTVTGMILGLGSIIAEGYLKNAIITYVLGGVLGGGLIALIIIGSKIILGTEGMGWGDAEICLVCGLFLGLKLIIVMLLVSFVLGGIIGVALIAMKIKSRQDCIPFGPFIVLAAIFTVFFGQGIVSWYFSMLMR